MSDTTSSSPQPEEKTATTALTKPSSSSSSSQNSQPPSKMNSESPSSTKLLSPPEQQQQQLIKTTTTATTATTSTTSTIFRNALCSTAGAAVTATVVTPLDVVKVRIQAHVCPVGGHSPCEDPHHVSTSLQALRNILRHEGPKGLWKGLNVTLLLALPTTGIYFTLYELFRSQNRSNNNNNNNNNWFRDGISGASARIVAASIASPLELARTSVQAGVVKNNNGVWGVLKDIRNVYGIKGWWNGLGPTLIRDAPFSAIYWSVYECLKRYNFTGRGKNTSEEMINYLTSGIGAGALAAFCTVPADVVKTRRQTAAVVSLTNGHNGNCSSVGIVREIVSSEGVKGLFKGAGPRVGKVAPACAIMMGCFEMFKNLFVE